MAKAARAAWAISMAAGTQRRCPARRPSGLATWRSRPRGGYDKGADPLKAGTSRSFSGSGSAAQSNSLTGFLTVTVTRVFENGNMEIAGQKKLRLNNGDEYVRLTGLVRPEDISATNLIVSNRIADAEITYVGAGEVADSSRQGWLSRTMRAVSPF